MNLIFVGSSSFAIPALEELLALRRHKIPFVISQPEKPKGRNLKLEPTELATAAMHNNLEVYCPEDINCPESINRIAETEPDLIVTASYGGFLGRTIRNLAKFKAINLHPSLLPAYRGASPIQTALLSGDNVTGNTIFRLNAKMDAGHILMQECLDIMENESYSSLHDRLANQAAQMLINLLPVIGEISSFPQPEQGVSHCMMFSKEHTQLDFSQDSKTIQNKVRAFSIEPGAFTMFRGKILKILDTEVVPSITKTPPGMICNIIKNRGFTVSTADGELMILKVQAAGKKMMDAWSYHLGAHLSPGERVG